MKLVDLKKGQLGIILSVDEAVFRRKLQEMGCVPGARIRMIMKAPLGDPIAFDLEGYTLSMRKTEAAAINIQLQQEV